MTFTSEELEELRRYDTMIDAAPMTYEDYQLSDFVEALLFPERERARAKQRAESRRRYERRKEKARAYDREYQAAHREEVAARKRAWYQANRGRVLAQQKAYRKGRARPSEGQTPAAGMTAPPLSFSLLQRYPYYYPLPLQ